MILVGLLLFLIEPARSCSRLTEEVNVGKSLPFKNLYSEGDVATITCSDNYVVSWGSETSDNTGQLECTAGGWKRQGVPDYSGFIGCVACISGTASLDCTSGTCSAEGTCQCEANYKKSQSNPRVCEKKTCSLTLSNAAPDAAGPYTSGTVVTVTCTAGYHVTGTQGEVKQVLTCTDDEAFTPIVKNCIVCKDNSECVKGTCNDNFICECDKNAGYKLAEGKLNVCEEVTCTEDYCKNNGVCTKKGIQLECQCPTGTSGDKCETFTSDPCSSNPCKNTGSCSRDMSNKEDVTKSVCNCNQFFEGDLCQFAKVFHIGASKAGAKIQSLNVKEAEFNVKMAAGASDMYIALIKGKDNLDNDIKIVLRRLGKDGLELSVSKQTVPYPTTTVQATGLNLAAGAVTKLKLSIDTSSKKIKLEVDDELKVTSNQVAGSFSEVWFGGSPTDCSWDQVSCSAGVSRTFYRPFVGSFHAVVLGSDRQEFGVMGDNAVTRSMSCSDYSCVNGGTCSDSAGCISCTCSSAGLSGLDCDRYTGVSFNGYSSSLLSTERTIPIDNEEQTLTIDIEKSEQEVGEILRINPGKDCNLKLSTAGGTQYTLQDKGVSVAGSTLSLKFDGTNAQIGATSVPCSWDFSNPTSTIEYRLGGEDISKNRRRSASEQKIPDKRYQGCVSALRINGLSLLQLGSRDKLSNLATDKCVRDYLPDNPCETKPSPCSAGWSCSTNPDDYSAVCKHSGKSTGSSGGMNNTTIIILIVALLVVIVLGVVIIFIVKKQKVTPINVIISGKQKGWFSPEPPLVTEPETPRPTTREHMISNDYVISNLSADRVVPASQRAVKLNYSAHQT